MRVLIELLDREPMANVLGACIFKPEIVVYLCDHRDSSFFKESAIYRLFKRRKMKTQPRFYYFDAFDPVGIRRVLGAVVRDYPGCVFDFTGGSDLVLLVAGACFSEMQVPAYYIDIPRQRFINIHGCEKLAERFAIPTFCAEDFFAMCGATVHGHGHFSMSAIDAGFEEDVLRIFDIVVKNPKAWGEFVSWLQAVCSGTPSGALRVEGPKRLKQGRSASHANPALLRLLQECGAFTRVSISKSRVELAFKSALHRKCLLIEGVWLELYCYVVAKRSGAFDDVRTSIVVDWDGVEGGADSVKNEVDVFLAKGTTSVFISCKMSIPSALALSEVKLLSQKFGGGYSRAVVLTAGSFEDNNKTLRARAEDLDIFLLDRQVLKKDALLEELRVIAGSFVGEEPRLVDAGMLPTGL